MTRRRHATFRWRSPLDVAECQRRLHEACDEERLRWLGWGGYLGSRPVIARFDGPRFTLHRRGEWREPAAMEPLLLSGRLVEDGGGTLIVGGIHARWIETTALFGSITAAIGWVTATLVRVDVTPWPVLLFLASIGLIGHACWSQARRERAFLTQFVQELLGAAEAPAQVARRAPP